MDVQQENYPELEEDKAAVQFALGVDQLARGRSQEALSPLREAFNLKPQCPKFATAFAHALHTCGHLTEAVGVLEAAVSFNFEDSELLYNLATLQLEGGWPNKALTHLEEVVLQQPDDASAWHGIGLAQLALCKPSHALIALGKAVELSPQNPAYQYDLGNALLDLKDYAAAIEAFKCTLELSPEHANALSNLGHALVQAGKFVEARDAIEKVFQSEGRWLDFLTLGHLEFHSFRLPESKTAFLRASNLAPAQWEPLSCLGVVAHEEGNFQEALSFYERALKNSAYNPDILWNQALTLLTLGEFERGWIAYESRWDRPDFPSPSIDTKLPLWAGQKGRVLIHTEQGLGDSIQFVRFLRHAINRCEAGIVLTAEPELVRIFRSSSLPASIVSKADALDHESFDFHIPLMSLPKVLGIKPTEYSSDKPYIIVPRTDSSQRVISSSLPRIGLVWEGNQRNLKGLKRSIPQFDFLQAIQTSGVKADYFCLHPDAAGTTLDLENGNKITSFCKPPDDLAETAALIETLDLVVSVDTAVAHLAASMGIDTWILLCAMPDWRWNNGGNETLWYPDIHIYRQQVHGQWTEPLQQLAVDMSQHFTL